MNESVNVARMDIHQVLKLLPHRYPFLLVDRVIECVAHKRITAIKNVTYNEPFFQGHFPKRPVMPGVLILEALAQSTGLLAFYSFDEKPHDGTMYYLVGVDKARFKRPVEPGDQLIMEVELLRQIKGIYRFAGVARVEDKVVSTAEFMTTKMEIES